MKNVLMSFALAVLCAVRTWRNLTNDEIVAVLQDTGVFHGVYRVARWLLVFRVNIETRLQLPMVSTTRLSRTTSWAFA